MPAQASVHSGPPSLTSRHRVIATTVLVIAGAALAAAFIADRMAVRMTGDSLVLRCERLSGAVGKSLSEHGIAADSADWRRQKQLAFRACLDDSAAFERLISAQ